ncbi:MAG: metallophosphatase family protein [Bryobacteraceae bacterium]|nr:metallophosphatase family protein [Bryobacteraceae bacterium]
MRYLILSDIHANWQALEAVLADAAGQYDRILCLGDYVGYGASPNEVVDWARAHVSVNLRGNHDRAACGLTSLDWFNDHARASALWTMAELSAENKAWLRALPQGPLPHEDFALIHGAPLDEDEYITSPDLARDALDYLEPALAFFGHTHLQGGFVRAGRRMLTVPRLPAKERAAVYEWQPGTRCLLNPGSVGQPRDRDRRAAYALYESGAHSLAYRRAEYDVPLAQAAIDAAGLPPILSARLAEGY